jgi:hypothetical protein
MKKLTKFAIGATCVSALTLYVTSGVSQAFVSDGKNSFDIVYWHVPLYGLVRMPDQSWWIFIRVWLSCLVIPPVLWIAVGARKLVASARLWRDPAERR